MSQLVSPSVPRGRGRPPKVRPADPCVVVESQPQLELSQALADEVDLATEAAFSKTYLTDPLFGEDLTALRGPLDSVLKRHGVLIEKALAWALSLNEQLDVMTQVSIPVSQTALDLCKANQPDATANLSLPTREPAVKTAIVDIVVHDRRSGRLILVSVKRGGGIQGGTVFRQDRLELRAAGLALKSIMTAQGLHIASVETVVVDWLGRSGVIAGRVVRGTDLDAFFGAQVQGYIAAMTRRLADGVRTRAMASIRAFLQGQASTDAQAVNSIAIPPDHRVEGAEHADDAIALPSAKVDLAACCAELPRRRQGRQMRAVRPLFDRRIGWCRARHQSPRSEVVWLFTVPTGRIATTQPAVVERDPEPEQTVEPGSHSLRLRPYAL